MSACSRQGPNRSAPENREHFLGGPFSTANTKNSLLDGSATKGGVHAISVGSRPLCAAWSIFHLPLRRSEPCRMAQRHSWVGADTNRRRHLLPAQSGGPRVPPAQSRRALKTRKEAMSAISRWPELRPSPAI